MAEIVAADISVWNGGAWVSVASGKVFVWNGTTWVSMIGIKSLVNYNGNWYYKP